MAQRSGHAPLGEFGGLAVQDAAIRILRYALDAPPTRHGWYRSDPQIRLTGFGWNVPKYNDFSMTLGGAYFPSHCP